MGKVAAFHAKNSSVYHDRSECTEGNNIETENLVKGDGKKKLCKHCERIAATPKGKR